MSPSHPFLTKFIKPTTLTIWISFNISNRFKPSKSFFTFCVAISPWTATATATFEPRICDRDSEYGWEHNSTEDN